MANYAELLQAHDNETLRNRVKVAALVAAETVRTEPVDTPNHASRLIWAKQVFQNPESWISLLWPVLVQNRAATLDQITGADDATVQTAVDAAINVFATGA